MAGEISRRGALGLGVAGAALAAATVTTAQAPAPGEVLSGLVLVNAASREGQDLSGAWHYSIDPYRDGTTGFHGAPAGFGHRRYDDHDVDAVTRANPTALIEYDMQRSPTVQLPAAWIAHAPALRHFVGLMWYQRAFTHRRAVGRRAFIHVGAANYKASVYLNGAFIGAHEGGFTPFALEVTERLRDGPNQITIGVDSEPSADTVPPPVTDWENYGGVTRAVRLVVTPETFIDDAWIRLTHDGAIAASVRLDGPRAARARVRVRIPALNLVIDGRTDARGLWQGSFPAPGALELWSPERPRLYAVSVEAHDDVLDEQIGFRTVRVEGENILLNGEPIFLRGICLHEEEIGPDPARVITPEAAGALLDVAKQGLGCNFVRLAHYPHSEIMTRMADRIGLLVWSEVPVYWRINWSNPATLATARRMQAENIKRDRNRASIILWSLANETPLGDARNAFLHALAADARALDDTRLITAALLTERREDAGRPLMVINDPLADLLDVLGVNTYNGWYSGDALSALPEIAWRSDYGKPMIFSEFGADAKAGFHDAELTRKFSEDFQAEYHRQTLTMSARIPFLRGLSPWILKDFRSPRRQHPIHQQGWNRKGLISETGARKQAFDVLAAHYRRLAGEHR
ncbi:MAG: glycoside hydrolase family 2 TIM barrel-domain containing protein [Terricaulis sp.]